jgi:hypothetical protein
MRMAQNCLNAFKEALHGIEEVDEDMGAISEHVRALEKLLKGAKKPKVYCIFLMLCSVIINDVPESNFLNCFIGGPRKGWCPEGTPHFYA